LLFCKIYYITVYYNTCLHPR